MDNSDYHNFDYNPSEQEMKNFYDNRFKDMNTDIINKAKFVILGVLSKEDIENISEAYKKNPYRWASAYHFGWGMSIRNLLRQNVCLDDKLPTGNWDDYYVQCVEYALGLR
jgi:hypothetical protein